MQVACGNCQQQVTIPAAAVGRRLKCPCCGTRLAIAADTESLANSEPLANAESHADPSSRADTESRESTWRLQTPDGTIYGPASAKELDAWYAEGRIDVDCRIADGDGAWHNPLRRYPALEESDRVNDPNRFPPGPVASQEPGSAGEPKLSVTPAATVSFRAAAGRLAVASVACLIAAAAMLPTPILAFLHNREGEAAEVTNSRIAVAALRVAAAVGIALAAPPLWWSRRRMLEFAKQPSTGGLTELAQQQSRTQFWMIVALLAAAVWCLLELFS